MRKKKWRAWAVFFRRQLLVIDEDREVLISRGYAKPVRVEVREIKPRGRK